MRVVLDTNIVVSRYTSPMGTPAAVLKLWQKQAFDVVVSEPILREYEQVLSYAKVLQYTHMSALEIQETIQGFRDLATLVEPTEEAAAVERDPDDNKVIACALAGDAEYIVSGDARLLDLQTYRGARMLTPALFLAVLDQEQQTAQEEAGTYEKAA